MVGYLSVVWKANAGSLPVMLDIVGSTSVVQVLNSIPRTVNLRVIHIRGSLSLLAGTVRAAESSSSVYEQTIRLICQRANQDMHAR